MFFFKQFLFVIFGSVFFSVISLRVHATSGCLFIKKNTNAIDVETETSFPFTKGRILHYRDYKIQEQKFLIDYHGKEYWIPALDVKVGPNELCSSEPKCFSVGKISLVYSDIKTDSRRIAKVIPGQKLSWIGKYMKSGKLWYQVEIGDSFGWILANTGSFEDKACPNSQEAKKLKLKIGFEVGSEMNLKSTNYESAITTVANPDDVSGLQNPFFTELKKGKGSFFTALFGFEFKEVYRFETGVGYAVYTYSLVTYANPETTTTPLSSLTATDTEITEKYALFPLGFYYKIGRESRFSLKPGVRIDLLYPIEKPFEYAYYTGSRYKQQLSSTFSVGPTSLQHKESLELRFQYRIGTDAEIGLSCRYSTLGSQMYSFLFEF